MSQPKQTHKNKRKRHIHQNRQKYLTQGFLQEAENSLQETQRADITQISEEQQLHEGSLAGQETIEEQQPREDTQPNTEMRIKQQQERESQVVAEILMLKQQLQEREAQMAYIASQAIEALQCRQPAQSYALYLKDQEALHAFTLPNWEFIRDMTEKSDIKALTYDISPSDSEEEEQKGGEGEAADDSTGQEKEKEETKIEEEG